MREFATVAEIADEIRRRLQTRRAESTAPEIARSDSTAIIPAARAVPPVRPIDPHKVEYTVSELLAVPQEVFITNLYRSLLKRDPDPAGRAHFSGLWVAGVLAVDIIYDFSRSPETTASGVRVKGLGTTALRRRFSGLPVVGRLFNLAAHLIYLPELAMEFRAWQRRLPTDHTQELEREIDSLRAKVLALMEQPASTAIVPNETDNDLVLMLLAEKVGADQLAEAMDDKVTRQELLQSLETKADLEQLAELEQRKADKTQIDEALVEQAGQIDAIQQRHTEQRHADHQQVDAEFQKLDRRVDSVEQSLAHKAETSAVQQLASDASAMGQSVNDVLHRLDAAGSQQKEVLSIVHKQKLRTLDIERRLAFVLEEARKRLPAPMNEEQIASIATQLEGLESAIYADFEDIFRGTREDIKERQSVYLPYLENILRSGKELVVLDIGCGRGEFLELLRDRGHEAAGVDANPVMVDRCHALGLNVERADAIEHLRTLRAGQYTVVTAFHVVEHLPHSRLCALIDEALRILRPGGLLILETPNPQNLVVGASSFYLDPTHLNPIPPALLRFVAEARGFVNVEVKPMHPVPEYARPYGVEIPDYLADLLYGPQDYGILAWKA